MEHMSGYLKEKKVIVSMVTAVMIFIYFTAFCACGYAACAEEDRSADPEDGSYRIVAHGGGEIDGIRLTNSLEAVQNSIDKGFRLIELDMLLSSDGKVIMIHDLGKGWTKRYFGRTFDKRPTEEEFLKCRIKGRYTPLSFDMLKDLLDQHREVRIITDCKEINEDLLFTIARDYPEYKDRIIPQIYHEYQYNIVKNMGFRNIIFTLYSTGTMEYYKLATFIDKIDLFAVTVGTGYKYSSVAARLARHGTRVYMHPVEDIGTAMELFKNRIYGVYTTTLTPAGLETERAKDIINDWNIMKEEIYATCI